jgi:hypothetical protein
LEKGRYNFQCRDKRDRLYNKALFLVDHYWKCPKDVAESLQLMLFLWNQRYYRKNELDIDKLQTCITNRHKILTKFRQRDILDYTANDNVTIREVFQDFLDSLQSREGTKNKEQDKKPKTPTAKALHLIAPNFFPLWDHDIRAEYGCRGGLAGHYLKFMKKIKRIAESLDSHVERIEGMTLLKRIDMYNYEHFTENSL